MPMTNYYVDPVGGNDTTGNGTIGTPWKTVQKALNTITRDTTNGDQVNVKAGGADTLSSALTLATYGTPTEAAPLAIRGYTSAANDGGIGEISGGGSVAIYSSTTIDAFHWVDMKLGNCGTNQILRLDDLCALVNCEFHTTTNALAVQLDIWNSVERCYFHTLGTGVLQVGSGCIVDHCRIVHGGTGTAIRLTGNNVALRNTIRITNTGTGVTGINIDGGTTSSVLQNSIYSSVAAAGAGIDVGNGGRGLLIKNNIIQGFSDAAGVAIKATLAGKGLAVGNNAFYNNTTNINLPFPVGIGSDISLANAPFTDPNNGDFTISSAAKAELQAKGYPTSLASGVTAQYLDVGAAQTNAAAAGGGGGSATLVNAGLVY